MREIERMRQRLFKEEAPFSVCSIETQPRGGRCLEEGKKRGEERGSRWFFWVSESSVGWLSSGAQSTTRMCKVITRRGHGDREHLHLHGNNLVFQSNVDHGA